MGNYIIPYIEVEILPGRAAEAGGTQGHRFHCVELR